MVDSAEPESCNGRERVGMKSVRRAGQSLHEFFWSNVKIQGGDGCWEWTGTKLSGGDVGYGLCYFDRKAKVAHRVAYEMHYGPIPDGLNALHRCDNRPCVRPDHLFLGTQADNVHDMHRKGRHRFVVPPPPRGELNRGAKLTAEQVLAIRAAIADGARSCDLAARYGVRESQIGRIKHGLRWRHLLPKSATA